MYSLKSKLFSDLTKIQKSSLLNFLKQFVKKKSGLSCDDIFYDFLDEQDYYLKINCPHFDWIYDCLGDEKFLKELKLYINAVKKELKYKETQKPFLDEMKKRNKKFQQKLKENKQKKEKPTRKQIYCYNKLCEKYNLEKQNTDNLSKFDLINLISKLKNFEA